MSFFKTSALKGACGGDPRQLARLTWSLLANNPIHTTFYYGFLILDLLVTWLFTFILVSRVHFQNVIGLLQDSQEQAYSSTSTNSPSLDENMIKSFSSGGFSLYFMRDIDFIIKNALDQTSQYGFILAICLLVLCILIILGLFIGSVLSMNHAEDQPVESQNPLKAMLCIFLVGIQTFLYMPLLDVQVKVIEHTYRNNAELTTGESISRYTVSVLGIFLLYIVTFYTLRFFTLNVPSEVVPWCAPLSKLPYAGLAVKAALVLSCTLDREGRFAIYEVAFIFVIQSIQAVYRLLFAPNYQYWVDMLIKAKDFSVALALFLSLICKILGDNQDFDLLLFFLCLPVVTWGWLIAQSHRKDQMLQMVQRKELKMEIDHEFALYLMMTLVNDSMGDNLASQKIFGQLMDLMITHIEECDDPLCICDQMENFYELLKLRCVHKMDILPLLKNERKKYRKILDDEGLIGTISNITNLTCRSNDQSQDTHQSSLSDHDAEKGVEESEISNIIAHQQLMLMGTSTFPIRVDKIQKKKNMEKKQNQAIFKVNLDETKHKFLSELLYLFYYEIIQKFPDSFKIQLLSNYFALNFKKKEMLCAFQMRSFNRGKLGMLDQVSHLINEQYLLYEIQKVQEKQKDVDGRKSDGNFNGSYFIKMNNLYKTFDQSIEELCSTVVSFWRQFDRTSMDVLSAKSLGSRIAHGIKEVFRVFQDLEQVKVSKDYNLYFKFAITQLHILNDPAAYDLYIGKMKSILEINKIYQKNFNYSSNQQNRDYSNFIIVDANGHNFGNILQTNASLRALLGWTEQEADRQNIVNFMPQLIQQKHNAFMKRFNQTGQSYIINNKATMFIKRSNGYVIPVELYIKFHYSYEFRYTFLAVITPFHEMAPFGNRIKYNINQLLFLLVADDIEGEITEYSESLPAILKPFGLRPDKQQNALSKRISDIVVDLNYAEIRNGRVKRYDVNEIYENVHLLNLKEFSDEMYQAQALKSSANINQYLQQSQNVHNSNEILMNAKVRIFEERYSGGILDMNIFCIMFMNENEMSNMKSSTVNTQSSKNQNQTRNAHATMKNGSYFLNSINQQIQQVNTNSSVEIAKKEDIEELMKKDESHSATGSSSSSLGSSSASTAEFRNFHSFASQKTPKTLHLIIRLILLLYVIMISVASINLGTTITKQKESEYDVRTVKLSYDTMNVLSMNLLLFRVVLNIANGLEPESSHIIPNRYETYLNLSQERLQMFKDDVADLQRNSFKVSDEFQKYMRGRNVPLYYLEDDLSTVQRDETLNIAYNVFISKMTELTSLQMQELIINNSKYTSLTPSKHISTNLEKNIFFVMQNALRSLRRATVDNSHYYTEESQQHSNQNIVSTLSLALVSIFTIILIGLVIAPILTKVETRKYEALIFFLQIPKERLQILIQNCEYCVNMDEEDRYRQILKDYESFLGMKLIDQQIDQMRRKRDQEVNIANQSSMNEYGSGSYRKNSQSTGQYDQIGSGVFESKKISKTNTQQRKQTQFMESRLENQELSVQKIDSKSLQVSKKNSNRIIVSVYSIPNQDVEMDVESSMAAANQANLHNSAAEDKNQQEAEEEDLGGQDPESTPVVDLKNKFNAANLNFRVHKEKDQLARKDSTKDQEEVVDVRVEEIRIKREQIMAFSKTRKIVMIIGSLSIITVLSSYFLISYFLSIRTFNTASSVIADLKHIFFKGSCFDQTMNFLRETQIRNETQQTRSMETVIFGTNLSNTYYEAVPYFIDYCLKQEQEYLGLRQQQPPYFQDAQKLIEQIESSNVCDVIDSLDTRQICRVALNGMMNKGISNIFNHMFTQILKQHLQFASAGQLKQRNSTLLSQQLVEPQIVEVIDTKVLVLDKILKKLKQASMTSAIDYIKSLLNDFILGYLIFSIVLTLSLCAILWWSLVVIKGNMWDTNIILKILPIETLSRVEREEIKNFFKA